MLTYSCAQDRHRAIGQHAGGALGTRMSMDLRIGFWGCFRLADKFMKFQFVASNLHVIIDKGRIRLGSKLTEPFWFQGWK